MKYFDARMQPFLRAFIISDALLYPSLNLINLLFVVYVTTQTPEGTVASATTVIAIGLAARVIVELAVGKWSSRVSEKRKLVLIIGGMAAITMSYAGFALTDTTIGLGFLWVLNGIGWAIGHPAKLALVAKYINHDQASQEWGLTDALNMTLVIIIMAVGTYIVGNYSFGLLFGLAALINGLGIVPYLLYARLVFSRKK